MKRGHFVPLAEKAEKPGEKPSNGNGNGESNFQIFKGKTCTSKYCLFMVPFLNSNMQKIL